MTYNLASAARATVGARSGQEDAYRVWPAEGVVRPAGSEGLLAVLADGMGGHRGGAVAGQTACAAFTEAFAGADMPLAERLGMALDAGNDALAEGVERNASLKGMGCTLIGAWFDDTGLRWTSVGDSLLLLYRFPDVVRLNEDHSLGSYLDEQARRNEISVEEARGNRHRNALRSALTGAKIDLIDLHGEPLRLMAGDWVLLASDGIASLEGDELADIMYRYRDASADEMAEALISAVDAKGVPEQDNTTVVAVRVEGTSETAKTMAMPADNGEAVTLRTRRIGVVSGRKMVTPADPRTAPGKPTAASAARPSSPPSAFDTLLTKGPVALLLAAGAAFVLAAAIYLYKASQGYAPQSGAVGAQVPAQTESRPTAEPTKQVETHETPETPRSGVPDQPSLNPRGALAVPPPPVPQPAPQPPKNGPGPSTGPDPATRSAPARPAKPQIQTQSPFETGDPDSETLRDPGTPAPQEGGSPPRKPDRILSGPLNPNGTARREKDKKDVKRTPQ